MIVDVLKIAGNDSAGIWGELGAEAWDMWRNDPVFMPHSHEVGRVGHQASRHIMLIPELDATSEPEREQRLQDRYDAIVAEGRGHLVEWLVGKDAIVEKLPHLASADIEVRASSLNGSRR